MKAKTLTILAVLLMLALMVMPVLALSAVSATPGDLTNTTGPLATTSRADLTPTINITPLLLSSQQAWGTIVTQTLTISNTGSGDLVWQVVESPAAGLSVGKRSTPGAPPVALPAQPGVPAAMEIIRDGSFESGTPNLYWEEYSYFSGTPLCNVGLCNGEARTGSWWAWFGGANFNDAGSAYLSQTVVITPGLATLEFWMKFKEQQAGEQGAGNFTVTLDSTIIFTANQTMTSTYANYTLVARDVTAFADGQAHVLKMAESDPNTDGYFDLFVDDVSLKVIDCIPSNRPWLRVTPNSGTTGIGNKAVVNVVFNSANHAGTYAGTLCIVSNDPLQEVIKVPVTLKSIAVFLPLILR